MPLKFFLAVNGAEYFMPYVVGREQFDLQHGQYGVRHMTVAAFGAHAGGVRMVHGLLPFFFDPLHRVARGAKLHRIGFAQGERKAAEPGGTEQDQNGGA